MKKGAGGISSNHGVDLEAPLGREAPFPALPRWTIGGWGRGEESEIPPAPCFKGGASCPWLFKNIGPALTTLLCLSLPLAASADTIAVFVGPYKMFWEDEVPVQERAQTIAKRIASAAERTGWRPELKGECRSTSCLEEALGSGFDQAVLAEVAAGDASYEITVELATGEEHQLTLTGAFDDVARALEEKALEILKRESASEAPPPREPRLTAFGETEAGTGEPLPPAEEKSYKKIPPWLFFTVMSLSIGLTGTWLGLEVATHKKYEALRDDGESLHYWRTAMRWRTASQLFFGLDMAFITATAIMAPFTRFGRRDNDNAVSLRAIPAPNGGLVALDGRF